jgi:hypothetical protein
MRNRMMIIAVVGIMLLVVGCRVEYGEIEKVKSPCWSEEGKIIYIKRYEKWKTTYNTFGENTEILEEKLTLMECDIDDSNKREIRVVNTNPGWRAMSTNSSSNWIVVGLNIWSEEGGFGKLIVVKLDGSEIDTLGAGIYPDLSPDGSKIVYAKRNNGIWIMNRDGSGDHQIVSDTTASYPAWSPDGWRIAYVSGELFISDNLGNIIDSLGGWKTSPDWSKSTLDTIMACLTHPQRILKISLVSLSVDTLNIPGSQFVRWSPSGGKIISGDIEGFYVINIDGTNKHYIEP